MKFVFCLVLLGAVAIAHVSAIAGQSACRDLSEIGQCYPHHFDPVAYWCCEELNVVAVERSCEKGFAYMHLLRDCIPWTSWIWKKPVYPLTLA